MLDLPVIQKSVDVAGHMTFVCIGALVCMMLAWAMQIRVAGFWKAGLLSLTEILLGEALGLFFAKVVYFLVRFNYLTELGTWRFFMFSFRPVELIRSQSMLDMEFYANLSFFGGVMGVILAVFVSARTWKLPARDVLNRFAPAGALLVAVFRAAEYYLKLLGVGLLEDVGVPEDGMMSFPLRIGYDTFGYGDPEDLEYYLPVFVLESVVALAAMIFALVRMKDRDCFLRTLFYICLGQILLESMRATSIAWLFVRVEQLFCFLYVEAVLVVYAVRWCRKKKWTGMIYPAMGLLVCGVVIAGEFALDGKILADLSKDTIYIVMAAALGTLAAADVVWQFIAGRDQKLQTA